VLFEKVLEESYKINNRRVVGSQRNQGEIGRIEMGEE
jgi:hypothetical protein